MPEDAGKKNGLERIAESAWLRAAERIAVLVIVGLMVWVGSTLSSLQITVTQVRTAQKEAIAPGVQNLVNQYNILNSKMLEHKWFGRDDVERLDDQHRKVMDGLDHRLRGLEKQP